MPSGNRAVILKLLFATFFWGGTWIAGRVVVQEMAPLAAASWRFCIASLILGFLVLIREGRPLWSFRDWLFMTALGLSGIFCYNLFFLYGLRLVEAGRGALVVAFIPALIALADWLFFRTPMTSRKASGVCLALLGCLLVVTRGQLPMLIHGAIGVGEWLLLGCAFTWTAYTLLTRHQSRHFTALAMTFGGCFTGWLMLTAAALVNGSLFAFEGVTWHGWSSLIFLAVFGTVVAFTWYSEAIKRIGSVRTAAFINLVPIFAVLQGALLLDERLGVAVLAGGAIVLFGVFITNQPQRSENVPIPESAAGQPLHNEGDD